MAESWLIFVDTNILLDFYRLRGTSAMKQLAALEKHKDSLILTEQVHMEFLKHRQRVILEALGELKKPVEQKFPPFLSDYQPALMMKKSVGDAVAQYKKLTDKVEKILSNPARNDDVYKSLMRVFKHKGTYCLTRQTKERHKIRSLARKRFYLGYPPKKKDDTSMGDALNWEWIIHCAQNCPEKSNVVIVSRDGDYGLAHTKRDVLSDWLKKEFQERVSKKRKIEATELLTQAFKRIDVPVTRDEEKEEQEVAKEFRESSSIINYDTGANNAHAISLALANRYMDVKDKLDSLIDNDPDFLKRAQDIAKIVSALRNKAGHSS